MTKCADISDVEVIRAAQAGQEGGIGVFKALASRYPAKVVRAKLLKLDRRGLLDYGVAIEHAWPTEKGLELLP